MFIDSGRIQSKYIRIKGTKIFADRMENKDASVRVGGYRFIFTDPHFQRKMFQKCNFD